MGTPQLLQNPVASNSSEDLRASRRSSAILLFSMTVDLEMDLDSHEDRWGILVSYFWQVGTTRDPRQRYERQVAAGEEAWSPPHPSLYVAIVDLVPSELLR